MGLNPRTVDRVSEGLTIEYKAQQGGNDNAARYDANERSVSDPGDHIDSSKILPTLHKKVDLKGVSTPSEQTWLTVALGIDSNRSLCPQPISATNAARLGHSLVNTRYGHQDEIGRTSQTFGNDEFKPSKFIWVTERLMSATLRTAAQAQCNLGAYSI
jgi:hypothetical protein